MQRSKFSTSTSLLVIAVQQIIKGLTLFQSNQQKVITRGVHVQSFKDIAKRFMLIKTNIAVDPIYDPTPPTDLSNSISSQCSNIIIFQAKI